MEKVMNLFTELVKSEICNETPQLNRDDLTPARLVQLYQLSARHDLTHMVASALRKAGFSGNDEIAQAYHRKLMNAVYRHETMNYALGKIRKLFEEEQILFVPLKGSVLDKYYPEDWMRTRSDLDVLIREEDLQRAKTLLETRLNYKVHKHNYHDIAMISPENILLELHFRILEHEENIDRGLDQVWGYIHPVAEGRYEYEMTNEFLLFHVFAHMYYHFINGGCGLRFIADIWLMKKAMTFDEEKLQALYRECELETFVQYAEKLANVCFGTENHDEVTAMMEEYILTGGLFGSFESKIKARKTQTEGRNKYILRRIFMPFHEMQASYPKLEKKPVLYPYYMVKRWLKIFKGGTVEAAVQEIKTNQTMEQDGIDELKTLFSVLKGERHV